MPTLPFPGGLESAGASKSTIHLGEQIHFTPQFMKTHAIQWKSSVTGSVGTGTKRFEQEEAERLATELNEDYPDIRHEAVIPALRAAEPAAAFSTGEEVNQCKETIGSH